MTSESAAPRVGILGAGGRMGRALIQAVVATDGRVCLGGAFEQAQSPQLGADAGALAGLERLGVTLQSALDPSWFDVLIDFTRPEALPEALAACRSAGRGLVIGTTGFDAGQRADIARAAQDIAICMSGNFSVGIFLLQRLVEQAAALLGPDFDIEVVEAHHRHKVDAPSGTALMLGEAAAKGSGRSLSDHAIYARQGHTGPRPEGTIGFATVRGGDVVGDHTVHFLGDGERVELTHRASSRMNFARGAVRAAHWVAGRAPGLYSMADVLGGDR